MTKVSMPPNYFTHGEITRAPTWMVDPLTKSSSYFYTEYNNKSNKCYKCYKKWIYHTIIILEWCNTTVTSLRIETKISTLFYWLKKVTKVTKVTKVEIVSFFLVLLWYQVCVGSFNSIYFNEVLLIKESNKSNKSNKSTLFEYPFVWNVIKNNK